MPLLRLFSRLLPRLRWISVGLLSGVAGACEPTVVIGARVCPETAEASALPVDDAGPMPAPTTAVDIPWTTGFEGGGFCDYAPPLGFCYATGGGSYAVVNSPVHSGRYAAAFSLRGNGDQARCVVQGVFPGAAYYSAWYYVPALATNSGNWNLLHFQGAVRGQPLYGLWDVSLVNLSDGELHMSLFDFVTRSTPDSSAAPPIPIRQWFHLEVYFRRAKDATGEISVWQDRVMAVHLPGIVTDNTEWGQFYVGNLATALLPPSSTLYVDDVTIGSAP